jgi:hypothetical protein
VQAFAPQLVRRSEDGLSTEVPAARLWSALLAVVPVGLAVLVAMQVPHLEWVVVGGLGVRLCLCGELVGAFVLDPGLCGL